MPGVSARERRAGVSALVFAVLFGSAAPVAGQMRPTPRGAAARERGSAAVAVGHRRGTPPSGLLWLGLGRGVRFNNPYRLARPLGDTPESVSLAATYLDLGVGALFGPRSFRQGATLGGAVALQGIGQFVLTPSYLAELGLSDGFGLRGRVGVPVVVAPDTTFGLEAALGPRIDMAYGLGAMLELVGSVYFGAATDETSLTTIPMLSLQVGVFFDHPLSP